MAEIVGVAHLVVRVRDWGRSARWYQDVLGFERRRAEGFSSFVHPGAPFALLFRPTDDDLAPSSSPAQRLDHIALNVGSVETLQAWRIDLATKGIDVEIETQDVGSSITLHDPDGLEVELFAPAAGSVLEVPGTYEDATRR